MQGRVVVVGVTGGIAAYKACELVRWLRERGATVIVVMTPAATRVRDPAHVPGALGQPGRRGPVGRPAAALRGAARSRARIGGKVEHVDVAEVADAIVIAPATADFMARLVHGEAPDALTATVLASPAPLVICPAMDLGCGGSRRRAGERARPCARAARRSWAPTAGALASGLDGPGRLAEAVEAIVDAVAGVLERRASLAGAAGAGGRGAHRGADRSGARAHQPLERPHGRCARRGGARPRRRRDAGGGGPSSVDPPWGVSVDAGRDRRRRWSARCAPRPRTPTSC